ncbi:hypothetical protein NB037_16995, partial [Rathayibacter sp. ZW T2_19]|nr:hypothetical protein [Rathayibacter rubneri]
DPREPGRRQQPVVQREQLGPLQRAELLSLDDGLLSAAGFPGVGERAPDSVLYSRGVETVFTVPRRVR